MDKKNEHREQTQLATSKLQTNITKFSALILIVCLVIHLTFAGDLEVLLTKNKELQSEINQLKEQIELQEKAHMEKLSEQSKQNEEFRYKIDKLNAITANNAQRPTTYSYSGHLPTPIAWEADLIFNKNYKVFCENIGASFVSAIPLVHHYTGWNENRGGHFYMGWYYSGGRHCHDDELVYIGRWENGPNDIENVYAVRKYSGSCGDIKLITGATLELRALITCI